MAVTEDRKIREGAPFEGSGKKGMRLTGDLIVRAVALAAILVVAIVVAFILLRSPRGGYTVKAQFQPAAQLVKGNLVQTGGAAGGKVKTIDLTPDGQAEVTMSIQKDYAPLRRGTLATIRQASLSGVANRYVDLRMAPHLRPRPPLRPPSCGPPQRLEVPPRLSHRPGLDDDRGRSRPALQHVRP